MYNWANTGHFPEFFQLLENVETSSEENRFEALEKLFKFFDKNGDGKLSKVEASLGFSRIGRWEGKMENVFEELKGDDGKVSIEGEITCFYECIKMHNFTILSFFIRLDEHPQEQLIRISTSPENSLIPFMFV